MKTYTTFLIGLILSLFSCNQKQEKTTPLSFAPKVVEAHGYVAPGLRPPPIEGDAKFCQAMFSLKK